MAAVSDKFKDPTIILLSVAAAISFTIGIFHNSFVESIGIFIAIFLATGVAFYSEYKSSREFDLLNQVKDERAKVIREGAFHTVLVKDLAVGDVVIIEMGDMIPADGKILKTAGLYIDESLLTGESKPVEKTHKVRRDDDNVSFRRNMVYKGTLVSDGSGRFIITAIGDSTRWAKLLGPLARRTSPRLPFRRGLRFSASRLVMWGSQWLS